MYFAGCKMAEFWDIVDEHGKKTGRTQERGKMMRKGDFHPCVSVWIKNNKDEFLISQRASTKTTPNMWETTGGSIITGEDSLTAALRETKEELGISLNADNGKIFKSYTYPHSSGDGAAYIEVWIFKQNINITTISLQHEETCNAIWANKDQIKEMINDKTFVNYDYIDELFAFS